ncbi:hypothetical protein AMTR_s00117p00123710 [Amborella trichopoda]|uniref:Uncharacterized protein n=1 Tax=Amborella trichopoda TaxID=13333 RepID=W1NR43_AMBTC|nr:hypothetical protein AMTR_s00117p00123710 [Amborella trichopoda]
MEAPMLPKPAVMFDTIDSVSCMARPPVRTVSNIPLLSVALNIMDYMTIMRDYKLAQASKTKPSLLGYPYVAVCPRFTTATLMVLLRPLFPMLGPSRANLWGKQPSNFLSLTPHVWKNASPHT